ncbi:MAG: galactose mutarotase [Sedimentisphaerales bacterium]|nr:galactose mutarotase [Sedimentisphaerales bacterium]
MNAHTDPFGRTPDGQEVHIYTLTSSKGLRARIMNFGATLVSIEVPDRHGTLRDVVLGFDALEGYFQPHPYIGSTVGRYANRIGNARFTLDGVEHKLSANEGVNQLHGGNVGFDKKLWSTQEAVAADNEAWVKMTYLSKDGEEGYPGSLRCTVSYVLTNDDELRISYEAQTDKKTVVNLTNHSYWNLGGPDSSGILAHELLINSGKFTAIDKNLIPTGMIASVLDTPLDFSRPRVIGERLHHLGKGYDHNYVVRGDAKAMKFCAKLREPQSGRVMEILSTEPGIQLYTSNYLDGSLTGKGGGPLNKHAAVCLETQHFPDSPNKPSFPSTVLSPGEKFTSTTVHKFATE